MKKELKQKFKNLLNGRKYQVLSENERTEFLKLAAKDLEQRFTEVFRKMSKK